MKVFLPATAVMFFIGRILGGPEGAGEKERERNGHRGRKKEGWVDQRQKTERKRRSLVHDVRSRLWNFRNKREGW